MSKPVGRGSLLGLRQGLPALPRVAPVATTAEMEEKILGIGAEEKEESKVVFTSLQTDLQMGAASAALAIGGAAPQRMTRKKEPTVLMNAKLPLSLHARLKRTAQYNDISMTEILILAIEAELATGRYAAPPAAWGSDAE